MGSNPTLPARTIRILRKFRESADGTGLTVLRMGCAMTRMTLLATLAMLATASPAFAHGALKSAQPAQSARLDTVPSVLRLTFNEPLVLGFTRLSLSGPQGDVLLGELGVDSSVVVVANIAAPIVAGRYTVRWQIAGKDGHPVRGSYSFTVLPTAIGLHAPVAATTLIDTASASPVAEDKTLIVAPDAAIEAPEEASFDASSPIYVLIRWLTYVGLVGAIGAVTFRLVVLPRYRRLAIDEAGVAIEEHASVLAAKWGSAAALLLIVAAVFRLVAQSHAVNGDWNAGAMSSALLGTTWGWGWIGQIVLAAIVAASLFGARRAPRAHAVWVTAAVAAALLAFTPGLAGHAAAAPRFSGAAIVSNGLHILGAAGWIGGLAMLLFAGLPAALRSGASRAASVADMVNAFSPTALVFAAMVTATGVFAAWIHFTGVSDLWTTEYGRALLRKLLVLLVVAATGLYNWKRARPSLGDDIGTSRIRRSATAELVIAMIVLALTAVLVATPTPPAV